ncbi:siderophore-interacting protein [Microbacterium sp. SORGH_AS_0888]|uniref:siderophore-interacting protein n=1 Tax=Microbacterium sp. SORGH_AS_0888 TaxID=3041791 RepID=UPI00278A40ED|nr:siderophore-interacting protein [Microbacterium sp. SORGH_AS_0888]MDQ1128425.1 NADPH-dependent ferric siderophore reductase [Microbacterium sp. SORGH_AS_0888]
MTTVRAARPAYRPYLARVERVRRLSPHFVRITFGGEGFEHFRVGGPDQRIKVVLPFADGSFSDVGQHSESSDWYDRWRALPTAERNPFRTYTVRGVDPLLNLVDVDFVVHGDEGPAGAWAANAAAGQELLLVGPDVRGGVDGGGGYDWHPGTARRLLLAGDETAAPAIGAILESLDPQTDVDAFIEVPSAADALAIGAPHARVHWVAREQRPCGEGLIAAVTAWTRSAGDVLSAAAAPRPQVLEDIDVDAELLWDSPQDAEGEFYAWIAGESGTVKTLRRLLVQGHGVDRKRVAFMGYWRAGQSERME